MNEKIFRMIGLACRAGKVEVGEAKTEDRLRHKKSKLVIISNDASYNTREKFSDLCAKNGVVMISIGDRETLGNYTGRDFAVVLSLSNEGFAKRIRELAEETGNL